MAKRIRLRYGDVVAEGVLYEDRAPRTVAALWATLPFRDRAITGKWSGPLWRTEGDHDLVGPATEDPAGMLEAGDLFYGSYDPKTGAATQCRIGLAYGKGRTMDPFSVPGVSTVIGRIDQNLEALVKACDRIIYDGPQEIELSPIDER